MHACYYILGNLRNVLEDIRTFLEDIHSPLTRGKNVAECYPPWATDEALRIDFYIFPRIIAFATFALQSRRIYLPRNTFSHLAYPSIAQIC